MMATGENQLETGLRQAFADFAAVQTEQRLAFETGKLGDLAVWRQRRERVFGSLQYYLKRLTLEKPWQNGQLIPDVASKIQELLAGERSLENAVAAQRQIVQEKLTSMRKGKRVLTGYDFGRGNAKSARFLSSRT